jgi:hypothetical protein
MTDDYLTVLQHEFSAEDGSFLLQLRTDMTWDTAVFSRLTAAMLACCQAYDLDDAAPTLLGSAYDKTILPRWLAEGFWYVATFVKGHTSHPAWRERSAREPTYYERAYRRLEDLADWFFTGSCPYQDRRRAFPPL